jgi:hypothetical protein
VIGFGSNGLVEAIAHALFGGSLATVTILSHIAADALTTMGIEPFTPLNSARFSLSLVRAANPIANYALLMIGSGVCVASALLELSFSPRLHLSYSLENEAASAVGYCSSTKCSRHHSERTHCWGYCG